MDGWNGHNPQKKLSLDFCRLCVFHGFAARLSRFWQSFTEGRKVVSYSRTYHWNFIVTKIQDLYLDL